MNELIYDWNTEQLPTLDWQPISLLERTLEFVPELDHPERAVEALASLGLRHLSLGAGSALLKRAAPSGMTYWVRAQQAPAGVGLLLDWRQASEKREGPTVVVIEDALRLSPDELTRALEKAAQIEAEGVCLIDPDGLAQEHGVRNLLRFCQEGLGMLGFSTRLEWWGSNACGLAQSNGLVALLSGATRLHTSFFGLGPGTGGPATELALANLRLLGALSQPLTNLKQVSQTMAEALGFSVPANYPVVGTDAFRTGTGVHAAAIVKAESKGDVELADAIYSGVPASLFGFEQIIEVGPMAGASNVIYWLTRHGHEPTQARVQAVLAAAKESDKVLSREEIENYLRGL
ncbi:MAG: 2-isopropylmalate synthase [Candidatus Eremiobacteraeota bacterium]|nr:2-isopropylmalate synthase [Candidatus Eremiobacteraeota bacterium]